MATNKEFARAVSFYRAKIQNSISSYTGIFAIAVDKMPPINAGMLTISPNTDREEIVLFTATSYTPGLPGNLTIYRRGINPGTQTKMSSWVDGSDYNNVNYVKSHYKLDEIRMDVNHIHLNEKASIYDIDDIKASYASTDSGKGASLIGINDSGSHFASATVEGALTELAIGAPGVADATTTTPGKSTLSTITQIQTSTDTDGAHPYVVQPSGVNAYVNSLRASDAEATAGTDTTRYVTAKQVKDNYGGYGITNGTTVVGNSTGPISGTLTIDLGKKFNTIQFAIAMEGVSSGGPSYSGIGMYAIFECSEIASTIKYTRLFFNQQNDVSGTPFTLGNIITPFLGGQTVLTTSITKTQNAFSGTISGVYRSGTTLNIQYSVAGTNYQRLYVGNITIIN